MKYKCAFVVNYTDRQRMKYDYNLSNISLYANDILLLNIEVFSNDKWEYIKMNKIVMINKNEALTRFVISQQLVWDKLKEVLQGYIGIEPDIKHPFTRFEIDLPWKNNLKQRLRKEIDKINRELHVKKNKYHIEGELI